MQFRTVLFPITPISIDPVIVVDLSSGRRPNRDGPICPTGRVCTLIKLIRPYSTITPSSGGQPWVTAGYGEAGVAAGRIRA